MFSQFRGVRGIRNVALVGLGLILALDFLGPCRRRKPARPDQPSTAKPTPLPITLKADEVKKFEVDTNKREVRYAIRKPDGTIETKVVEGVRRATITETKDGTVIVRARPWGFTFEPGLGVAISNGPRIAGDVQFFFYDRFGANIGAYYNGHLRLFLAGSYTLTKVRLFNSSVWLGADPLQKELLVGFRVRI